MVATKYLQQENFEKNINEHTNYIQYGHNFVRADFSGFILNNLSISNRNLNAVYFTNALFENTDFAYSRFIECDFSGSSFVNCNFSGAVFINCSFQNTHFYECYSPKKCIFEKGYFKGMIFKNCNLKYTGFNNSYFERVLIEDCDLYNAFFENTIWKAKNHIVRTNLAYANFNNIEGMKSINLIKIKLANNKFKTRKSTFGICKRPYKISNPSKKNI